MRKTLFLLLFIQVIGYAQSVKLTWSPEIDNKRKVVINDIIYSDNSGIYYTTVEKKGGMFGAYKPATFSTIEKLSSSFTPVFSKEFEVFDKDYAVDEIDYAKKHFLVFLNKYEKKEDGSKYYVANMDMNGNVNGSAKEYLSVNEDDFAKAAELSISSSFDSTKFLILAERGTSKAYGWGALREYNKNKKEEEKLIVTVLKNDGSKAWQKTISIGNKADKTISIIQEQVTPDGDVFFLLKEYLTDKMKETIKDENGNKVPGYKYRILKINNGGNGTNDFAVDLGKLYINSADIKINTKTNNLICSGFYNDQDNEVLKGLFYFEIDNLGKVIKKNNKDFPQEFVEEFKKHKETKKDRKNDDDDLGLLKGFTVDKVYARADGGAYLLAEYYDSKTVCYTSSNGSTRCNTYYYHNDILTVNIGADGTIDWFYRIPKRQTEVNINKYASYISTLYKDNLYILFNDNPKNLDNEDDDKSENTVRFKKSVCALQKIDKTKNITKQELFKNEEIEKILCPFKSRVLNENTIILYADKYRDNDPKLGKIVIE